MQPAASILAAFSVAAWLTLGASDAAQTTPDGATARSAPEPLTVSRSPLPRPAPTSATATSAAPSAARAAALPTTPASRLAEALAAARAGNWAGAEAAAARMGGKLAPDMVHWLRLRDGAGTWAEYRNFLGEHADWPNADIVRRQAERQLPASLPPRQVFLFFGTARPETGTGVLRLAHALAASGRTTAAEAEVIRAWRNLSLSAAEQRAFRDAWGSLLAGHHVARLDNLLWRGWVSEAEAMMPLVGEDWQKLARARIMTRQDAEGLNWAINQVPEALRGDPGLAFERYRYRVEKARWDEAETFLLEMSRSPDTLGRPEMWMERRANLARQALRRGDVDVAYALAANSYGDAGAAYADAEWVAGFIALTRMDNPEAAAGHFERFLAVVGTPISIGRGGYWLGRAQEELGNPEAAADAYAIAAAHQTSFYGQLAAEKAGTGSDATLVGGAQLDWHRADFLSSSSVRAARLLALAGDEARSVQFLRHAASRMEPPERAALAQMAIDTGMPHVGVRIAKDAAAAGVILPAQYYPLHAIAERDWPVPAEFAMAIARQESELNPAAMSSVGARGLMQLMPATARQMAETTGAPFSLDRLTEDPIYNAELGTAYLAQMLRRYNGSYILASAAYNAGPGRVDEWLRVYGDPRLEDVDAVTWIEMIPFTETRNYVMRVLEGLHVYRARLGGEAAALRLHADIKSAG